jgi:CRP/FNR family transcriptional regulator
MDTSIQVNSKDFNINRKRTFLGDFDIFKSLDVKQLAEISPLLTERKIKKGEALYTEGDQANYLWFIKEGRIRAVKHTLQGRDLIVCSIGSKQMFGTCCCFQSQYYPCSAIADTDTTVIMLPMEVFSSLMGKYPQLSKELVRYLSERLRRMQEMRSFDQETVERRILHVLVYLINEFGETIPLTRREIAEMAGTTVETCIRTFKKFEKDGLVDSARKKIHIKNLQKLNERLEEME